MCEWDRRNHPEDHCLLTRGLLSDDIIRIDHECENGIEGIILRITVLVIRGLLRDDIIRIDRKCVNGIEGIILRIIVW